MKSFVKTLLRKENVMMMKCFITVPKPAQTALRASLSLATKILCELMYQKLCCCFQDDQNSKFYRQNFDMPILLFNSMLKLMKLE